MLAAGKSEGQPKKPRSFDRDIDNARHLIENFFAWLKQYRVIATRYDKTALNFLRTIHFVATVIWFNWRHAVLPTRPFRNGIGMSG